MKYLLTNAQLTFCCSLTGDLSPSYRLKLIHFKYLHQIDYTSSAHRSKGLRFDDCCARYRQPCVDFIHLEWSCLLGATYWCKILDTLSKILDSEICP